MNGTPAQCLYWGQALKPTSVVTTGTAIGARIINPSKWGKHLSIFLMNAGLTGVTAATVKLRGSNDGGNTWNDCLQNDGATPLAFTGAKFLAAGAYDAAVSGQSGVALGSIDLSRGSPTFPTYTDYRIEVTTNTGATVLWAAVFVVSPTREKAVGVSYPDVKDGTPLGLYGNDQASAEQVDEFLNLALPTGAYL